MSVIIFASGAVSLSPTYMALICEKEADISASCMLGTERPRGRHVEQEESAQLKDMSASVPQQKWFSCSITRGVCTC